MKGSEAPNYNLDTFGESPNSRKANLILLHPVSVDQREGMKSGEVVLARPKTKQGGVP